MDKPLPPTRSELAFVANGNSRLIRAFENLFRQSLISDEEIQALDIRIGDLENPHGLIVTTNHQLTTDDYWIVASVTGLTVTLPKCEPEILGREWAVTLGAAGDVTIVTSSGDTFATPADPAETTAILNRRGSTVSLRCTSVNTWSFA